MGWGYTTPFNRRHLTPPPLCVYRGRSNKNILENCQHEGGISGKPLFNKSSELIRKIKQIDDEVFLIGVGGVFSKNDYQNKISDGASLIQVYTGFIYEGPSIVKNILS